ncbi:hypothetical protein IFM89_013172 [Coptis chinensis]|uniref:Uncharacterized protein n=1 Tax=Coptis chinensis TaxID=261450 RepID=A0A835I7L7_9MAGN|nr:hypothetical protein IFM89_013172 [Coptis chinensis]
MKNSWRTHGFILTPRVRVARLKELKETLMQNRFDRLKEATSRLREAMVEFLQPKPPIVGRVSIAQRKTPVVIDDNKEKEGTSEAVVLCLERDYKCHQQQCSPLWACDKQGNRRNEFWQEKVFAPHGASIAIAARAAMDWGVLNETAAIEWYHKRITGRDVSFLRFAIHAEENFQWLGTLQVDYLRAAQEAGELMPLGREEDAKAYMAASTHMQTGLMIAKSLKLAAEAKLLCREIAAHVEFYGY